MQRKLSRTMLLAGIAGLAVIPQAYAQFSIVTNQPGTFVPGVDIAANLVVGSQGDDNAAAITIPAAYGNGILPAGAAVADTNGRLLAAGSGSTFTNAALTTSPAGYYPYWDDLRTDQNLAGIPASGIYAVDMGTMFVVQWDFTAFDVTASGTPAAGAAGNAIVQLQIFPTGSGTLAKFLYQGMGTMSGQSATVGEVSTLGPGFAQYEFNTAGTISDTTVVSIVASTVPGACCLGNGTCVPNITAVSCVAQGGVFQGENSVCGTCPVSGACCFASGNCLVVTNTDCASASGVFRGGGTTCATANCPAPAGKFFVPAANATVASGAPPFDTLTREFARTYQQTFAASEINIPAGGKIGFITLRSSNAAGANPTGTWPPSNLTWANYTITLGRAAFPPGSMSTVFADNIAAGTEVTVHSGPLTMLANSFTNSQTVPTVNPPGFSIPITPYTYTGGDLVMTIRHGTHNVPGVVRHFVDCVVNPTLPSTQVMAFSDDVSATGTPTQSAPAVISFIPAASTCYANCDASTTQPCLNVLDFGCFLNRFAASDTYANCDGSTTQPVLNVLDFGCFLNRFAAGCSSC